MGTKQLRLDVAQLTDVGRRREHNEDNMAYVIPKDQQVMAKKGALFIVADGMGGHAAGEVASEIAVDTVSNIYYQDDSDDVAVSLLHAIKRANALIHQRAAENMLRSGMGTTCVAAVLRGNMAYIANVGDSRAYLVHSGQVKQVSQDHSWVAEQVRAGLLTEEQARTHAQRNVITRCLGTQADVEIDVFPEPLEEKDALVLCTDGLSGLVNDDEIRRIIDQSGPQESVYHLVERANENGGPDNITAIVVSVQEVGSEPPNARHPVYVGGREAGEDTTLMGIAASSSASAAPAIFGDSPASSGPLRYPSGPLAPPDTITAPQPVVQVPPRRRRNRLLYPALALLVLFVLASLAGGGYYYYLRTNAGVTDQHLQNAKELIARASREVSTNPAAALQDLASAQSTLRSSLLNDSFSGSQHTRLMRLLQTNLTAGVKAAIMSYNLTAKITSLPCANMPPPTTLNEGTTGTQAKTIASVQGKNGSSLLFALGQDNKLYKVTNNSLIPFALPSPLNTAKVLDIASYGPELAVLAVNGTTSANYVLALLAPDTKKLQATSQVNPEFIKNGQTPKLIAVDTPDVYVVLASDSSQQSLATILDYPPNKQHQALKGFPTKSTISVSEAIVSMAAFPQHQLYFLLADGSVQNLSFTGNTPQTSVFVQQPIAPPLAVSANDFTWQKAVPVPTATSSGSTSLAVPGATSSRTLVAALVNNVPHLYILDAVSHRLLDLQVVAASSGPSASSQTPTSKITPTSTSTGGGVVSNTPSPVTLLLNKQYASATLLTQAKSMTVDAQGSQVTVVTQTQQSAPSILSLISFTTNSPNGCA